MPYDYISTQDVAKDTNLNAKYDAIIFAPVGRARGDRPWHADVRQSAPLEEDAADAEPRKDRRDRRYPPGPRLERTRQSAAVRPARRRVHHRHGHGRLRGDVRIHAWRLDQPAARGSSWSVRVLRSKTVDATSPIAYGYGESFAIYCDRRPIFNVEQHGRRRRRRTLRRRRAGKHRSTRPGEARRTTGHAAGPAGRRGRPAQATGASHGRRRPFTTSSAATASMSSRLRNGHAS